MSYFKESSQEVNKVYKTNDLSKFQNIKGNRPPNPQHIRRLTGSMKEHGILQNPIIVNESMDVIDGQHRLLAAKEANVGIYYIIVKGYSLSDVHVLNLNQKNWTKKDFMNGYADMEVEPYIKLREFAKKNSDYNLSDCVALCSNISGAGAATITQKYRKDGTLNGIKEIFEEGTWKGKDFKLAQDYADKIRMVKPYYDGYNRSSFVSVMIGLFKKPVYIHWEFLHKLKLQPNALVHCASASQYKILIEEIYNYRRRNKVNLRY